jgi:oligoendopeptidase F
MAMNAQAPIIDDLPRWNLGDLYTGREDPAIERDLAEAEHANDALAAMQGQFLATQSDPADLGARLDRGIRLYEQATNKLWAVEAYASLSSSVAQNDPGWAKFESDLRGRSAQIGAKTLFFTLELNALPDSTISAALAAHAGAARWAPWLRRVRLNKPHELSHEAETMIVERSPAVAGWSRLYDETLSRLRVKSGKDALSLPEALNRLSDPSPAVRKATAQSLGKALEETAPVMALAYNTLAFEKQVEDRWRHYSDPAHSRHIANEVDKDAVDALEAAVVETYPAISHRYYRLKAKLMGVKALNYWDRNAPLSATAPRRYSWDEAKEMVLESFAALAPKFAETAIDFFAHPWIDAAPRPGKSSGAYSHPVTADRHPYVFMNYMGERRDVLTLAHELGHAVHQTLAAPLGTLLADTPLTLAETASIFGEGLVFERLLDQAVPADRRALLAGKIEDGINTVVRQIAFHRFETRFHDARAQGEVSAEQIGALWMQVMGESLGPAVKLNPGYEVYWAYVGHFVHAPFYVYAYAFGDLLVEALMEARRNHPDGFAPIYQALLAGGGTQTYVEALAPFGLNPRDKAFWAAGCARLERLVDAFEALVD